MNTSGDEIQTALYDPLASTKPTRQSHTPHIFPDSTTPTNASRRSFQNQDKAKRNRSAPRDLTSERSNLAANDTLSLDLSVLPLPYKPRADSSMWMNDYTEILGNARAKDSHILPYTKDDAIAINREHSSPESDKKSHGQRIVHKQINPNPFGNTEYAGSDKGSYDMLYRTVPMYTQSQITLGDAMRKRVQERVQAAHEQITDWEARRLMTFNQHKAICESIFNNVQDRMAILINRIRDFLDFFKSRIDHEKKFARIGTKFSRLNKTYRKLDKSADTMTLFDKALQESDQYQVQHTQKNLKMAEFIETEIMRGLLQGEEGRLRDRFEISIRKYKRLRGQTKKEASDTHGALTVYLSLLKKASRVVASGKDPYMAELSLLRNAQLQTRTQRELGQAASRLLGEIQSYEALQLEKFADGIKLYIKRMDQLYGGTSNDLVLGALSRFEAGQEIKRVYSLQQVLLDKDLVFLKERFQARSEVSLKQLSTYLTELELPFIKQSPLLFFDCQASVTVDGGIVGTKFLHVSLTGSQNVLIYDLNPDNLSFKVHKAIRLRNMIFKQAQEGLSTLEFIEVKRRWWLFGIKRKHVVLAFRDREEKKEFVECYVKFGQ